VTTPILATKLYVPLPRPNVVPRHRLIERLNEGLQRKLTLISAPAGFGKTTLAGEWVAACGRLEPKVRAAWLSLDEGDNDPTRFLTYLIAALQTLAQRGVEGIAANIGKGVLGVLQSPQLPPTESILTALLNEITTIPEDFVLVLDDYHVIEAKAIDQALTFLLEHVPPQMHLVIATREDPNLPLARLRGRGQLNELRSIDLRFTASESAEFLNQLMGLDLPAKDITALEARTEGWIAGLQLAAISMRGHPDAAGFIKSFTGSHHFVMDYLVEEVLGQQSESVQTFLLRTSILDRLSSPLCDALTGQEDGQATLEYLEQANLFIVPLDNERNWYRYHHLFADLLRKRLHQQRPDGVAELHRRASRWYEEAGMELEAFQHAAAGNDDERAARLVEGEGVPLHFRGAMTPVLNWLASLPTTTLDARPSLWVTYATALTMLGQPTSRVEEKLQAAEAALGDVEPDVKTRDLIGQIAAIRAMQAIPQNQVETIVTQSRRALEYLRPDNLPVRTTASWTLGFAHQLQGNRAAAIRAYTETISISQASGNAMITIAATTCLGQVQESENQLYQAAESYRRVLQLAGDPPLPAACEAHLGLARISYQWDDLDAAQKHGQQSLQLAQQMETVATPASCGVFLARLRLAEGDAAGAIILLAQAEQFVRQHDFAHWIPEVAAAQVLTLLHHGDLARAADLAEKHQLPLSQARVHLAQGETSTALEILEPVRQQAEAKGLVDEWLKVMVLQAIVLRAHGEKDHAMQVLGEALPLAEPGGFIRIFLDEGPPMAALLNETAQHSTASNYVRQILGAFGGAEVKKTIAQPLIEPLTERELEVLRLLGTYLKGPEIAGELMVSLNTMRTHTKNIYNKLGVNNRQAAVRRAQELDLL
jgi:LuxR family maltose regulon positive regulatory protein